MARIFIVGSGVVGTATGYGLSQMGHQVTFVDVFERRVDALRAEGHDACFGLDLGNEPGSFIFLTLPTPRRHPGCHGGAAGGAPLRPIGLHGRCQ